MRRPPFHHESNKRNSHRAQRALGMTLIEIMVVLVIIGLFVGVAVPRLMDENRIMKEEVRKLSVLLRKLRSRARMENKAFRLVVSMPENTSEKHRYWIESSGEKNVALYTSEEIEEERRRRGLDDDEAFNPNGFNKDESILKEQELRGTLRFSGVEVTNTEGLISSGMAYIHFFPSGLVEEAILQVSGGEKLKWSITVHPLTGKTEIVSQELTLKEVQDQ